MAVLIGRETQIVLEHLATEEYLLRDYPLKEDILYLWFGSKSFIFGRNQNPYIEINPKYLNDPSILKLRRISGGGTIYEDEGTLNFSIITSDYRKKINDYEYFLNPLIELFNQLGLNVTFKPKTHLYLNDFKISGNAQAFINHRLMHHGTLLFDTDLNVIEDALVNYLHMAKGNQVVSNKQAVTNLKRHIKIDKQTLLHLIVEAFHHNLGISTKPIIDIDVDKVQHLIKEKYQTWAWNYGSTPRFEIEVNYQKEELKLTVEKGIIVEVIPQSHIELINQKFDILKFNIEKES